jgi:broad specificity phosphatase PhoE
MEPPAITRHRRPFLAPLWLILLAAVAVAGVAWAFYLSATTTVVFLVRPVEKDPGTIDDPPVSPEGEERAQRLARMFGRTAGAGGIDAIYESDERRAQQTAAPLTQQSHRAPVVFKAAEARSVAGRALHEHRGGAVLIIASGAALSQIGQELTGADLPPASPDEPDLIYVISVPSVGHANVVRFRF